MAKDKDGNELAVGDRVLLEGKINLVDGQFVEVIVDSSGSRRWLTIHAAEVQRIEHPAQPMTDAEQLHEASEGRR